MLQALDQACDIKCALCGVKTPFKRNYGERKVNILIEIDFNHTSDQVEAFCKECLHKMTKKVRKKKSRDYHVDMEGYLEPHYHMHDLLLIQFIKELNNS